MEEVAGDRMSDQVAIRLEEFHVLGMVLKLGGNVDQRAINNAVETLSRLSLHRLEARPIPGSRDEAIRATLEACRDLTWGARD